MIAETSSRALLGERDGEGSFLHAALQCYTNWSWIVSDSPGLLLVRTMSQMSQNSRCHIRSFWRRKNKMDKDFQCKHMKINFECWEISILVKRCSICSWPFNNYMVLPKVRAVAIVFHFQDLSSLHNWFWNNGVPSKGRNHCELQEKEICEKLIDEENINVNGVQTFVNNHMERNKINNPATSHVKAKEAQPLLL